MNNLFLIFTISVLGFTSCEFSYSKTNDLNTGASSEGKGLNCEKIDIEVNGKLSNSNEFMFGDNVDIVLRDVKGLKKKGNKTFPGMSMVAIQNDTDTIMFVPDLFAEYTNGTELSPLVMRASFTTTVDHQQGQKFKIILRAWDKLGDGDFNYEFPFTINDNPALTIKPSNITFRKVYFWDKKNKRVINDQKFSANDVKININGLCCFEKIDGLVYPTIDITAIDSKGNNISLDDSNEPIELDATSFSKLLPVRLDFKEGEYNNPINLSVKIHDSKSDKQLEIKALIELY